MSKYLTLALSKMAISFLQRHEISAAQWNHFIETSPQRIVYAYTWYLDVVSPQWGALVISQNGSWQAVMPLPIRRKWMTRVIQQPFFCQLLGIFTHPNHRTEEFTSLFLQQLPAYFGYISIYAGRLGLNFISPKSYDIRTHFNYLLSLHTPYELIREGYSRDRRINLARAQKNEWQLEESLDIVPLLRLFKENHASNIEGGVAESAYELLKSLFAVLLEKNAARLLYATKNNQIEAGALFAISENRIIYLFNAASPLGRKGNARTWLIDYIIQQYANRPIVFDFESPEIPSIEAFYKSFGTYSEIYHSLRLNQLPFPLRQIQQYRLKTKK